MAAITAGLVGAAVVGAGVSIYEGKKSRDAANRSASAAGAAAQQQEAAAQKQFNTINQVGLQNQKEALSQSSKYNVQQLAALDHATSAQENYLGQQEKLLSAVDPTLMEASQQALKLLRGEKAQSLGPLENQRAQQRQVLQNSLRAQGLGDGSSAALNALNKFDAETANVLNTAQQSSLGTLLGTTLSANPNINAATGNLSALGQGYGAMGAQNASAFLTAGNARLGALSGAGQAVINSAGSKFTGDVIAGQNQANYNQNLSNQFGNLTGQLAGAGLSSYLAKPATTPDNTIELSPQTYNNVGVGNVGPLFRSDVAFKQNIEDVSNADLQEFISLSVPKTWEYINKEHGKGKFVGFMAQDLEKSKLGKLVVVNTPEGKFVDYEKLLPMLCAAVAGVK